MNVILMVTQQKVNAKSHAMTSSFLFIIWTNSRWKVFRCASFEIRCTDSELYFPCPCVFWLNVLSCWKISRPCHKVMVQGFSGKLVTSIIYPAVISKIVMSGLFAPFSGAFSLYISVSQRILASSFSVLTFGIACLYHAVESSLYTDNKRW